MAGVLTAAEVAKRLKYTPRFVRESARAGRVPAPIDPDLPAIQWRWSEQAIEQYEAGEWSQAKRGVVRSIGGAA
jgi:hypothetical protein